MLQNKFEMPLDLVIKPSKILFLYFTVIFLLSLISITITSSLSITIRGMLFFLLLLITLFIINKHKSTQVTNLRLNSSEQWQIEIGNKQYFDVELTGECIVTYFLIWLNFSGYDIDGKSKIFHLLLLPDSANKDLLRKLRVRLRFLKDKTAEENKDDDVIATTARTQKVE